MSQKQKGNAGYRLGLLARRVRAWDAQLADAAQRRGIPRWVAKIPALLILVLIGGLLIVGAMFLAFFIVLMLFIGMYIASALTRDPRREEEEEEEEYENYTMGPEGPGIYVGGKKVG